MAILPGIPLPTRIVCALGLFLWVSDTNPTLACDASALVDVFNATDQPHLAALAAEKCSGEYRNLANRLQVFLAFNGIATAVAEGKPLAGFAQPLEEAARAFGGPWQVWDALGDIAREQKNYAAAYRAYTLALEQVRDVIGTPDWMAPDAAYILRLLSLADEMRLAGNVKPLVFRCPCSWRMRGMMLKEKVFPDMFDLGRNTISKDGEALLQELFGNLKAAGGVRVTIAVHVRTDGNASGDMALSDARARTLSQRVRELGLRQRLETMGLGRSIAWRSIDGEAYPPGAAVRLSNRIVIRID
jgi:OOP family OmpA-OmpF porin